MLKVALINPIQYDGYAQPPMGLALIAAILEKANYPVSVFDANALRLHPEEVAKLVTEADVVGLTAMTPTIGSAISTARHLKQAHPELTVILGGPHGTLLPGETLMAAPEIDIIVRGEAEETIIALLQTIERKQALDRIPGLSYRRDGKVVINPPAAVCTDMDSLPFLAYHLLPWEAYKPHPPHGRSRPFAAIITSRGCPYHCSYCSKPVFGTTFRAQTPERVRSEITYHQHRFGVREIAFYDDVFTLNKQRAHDIADELLRNKIKIDWTCETRVNLVDKELLRHMRQAGCYAIAYGIESASPEILATISKGISLEQIEEAIRITREAGIQTIGYFMLGSPGESPETINQTIQFAKKLKLDFAQFAVTTPFPGTKLYELYLNDKKNASIPWESFVYAGTNQKVVPRFENDKINSNDLSLWVKKAYRQFYVRPSYVWQRLRRIRSIGDLRVNIQGLRMLTRSINSQERVKS